MRSRSAAAIAEACAARLAALTPDARVGAVLPDVERTTSWGAPTLKVRGKMMACQAVNKQADPNTLVVCMPIAERDELIAADPDIYYVKPHYEDYPRRPTVGRRDNG